MRRVLGGFFLAVSLTLSSCAGELIDAQPFEHDGSFAWETALQSSGTHVLWLRYEVETGRPMFDDDDSDEVEYRFLGHLTLRIDGRRAYDGGLRLAAAGYPLEGYEEDNRVNVTTHCNVMGDRCRESGLIELWRFTGQPADTEISVEGYLPREQHSAELRDADLQLRAP